MKPATYADILQRIEDMRGFIRDAREMIAGLGYDAWVERKERRYGAERTVELLGEASRNIPDSVKAEFPAIPWKKMMAMRTILAHDYGELDHEILYKTIRDLLPSVDAELARAEATIAQRGEEPLTPQKL